MKRRDDFGLGFAQKHVLRMLAIRGEGSVDALYRGSWGFGITESAIRSAINSLGDRGLVDVSGWDGRSRTFCLTHRGAEVEQALLKDNDETETDGDKQPC